MRLIVSGWHGQIARALSTEAFLSPDVQAFAVGRPALDVRDPRSIERTLGDIDPHLVINTAAYTNVDKAETEPAQANILNRDGAAAFARAAARRNIPIIHLSTHYVFDGLKSAPYTEDDKTGPETAYGRSKLEGEDAVKQANPHHIIIRTGWVYGPTGRNFVTRILDEAKAASVPIHIVADQTGNPTFAPHFARMLIELARHVLASKDVTEPWGTYHLAGSGSATWYEFAQEIARHLETTGKGKFAVVPTSLEHYPTLAKRPPNGVLDCSKFKRTFSLDLPPWQHGVRHCVELL